MLRPLFATTCDFKRANSRSTEGPSTVDHELRVLAQFDPIVLLSVQ